MRKLIALAAVALVASVASCNTKNIGGLPVFFSITGVTHVPGDPIHVNDNVTFTAAVSGAVGPYNVVWNFGGAATPNTVNANGENGATTSTTVMLSAQGDFTGTVTATDAANNTLVAGPFNFTMHVLAALNAVPTITSATYNAAAGTIAVVVADADAADNNLTVTVSTTPAGLTVTPGNQATTNGGTATFNVSATDILAGGNGNVGFTVSDGHAGGTSAETTVAVAINPFVPAADTLYGIPLSGTAAVAAPVTVLVLTGVPANPFQYMTGVGLTIESDADYVSVANSGTASFNVGAVGGAQGAPDGYWTAMNPAGGFLLAPDNFIQSTDIGGGRERWDFNITPIGGANQTTASGALFNCAFTFTTAGKKTFGFQDVSGVKRTYYSSDAADFFWGNIANDGTAIPNSVTIQ